MNFTREDLQRIAKGLKQLSIKDTQFANATALTTETKFPVVQGNVNVLLTSAQLLNFLVSNLDANSLTLNIPNWTSGTLSNLISRLYTIASAPRDEEGNPITAEDIEYSHYVDEEITSVADALDYVIAELLEKIDSIELAGTPRINPTQMPIITLANIEPASTCPISSGSGMWFDENHVLQYRNGAVTPAEDVEIGTPVDMLYYYNDNVYKYDVSSQAFNKVGSVDLSSCIKVDANTNRMPYAMLPWVVLIGLSMPTAQVLNRREEFCYYNRDTRKIVFHKSDMTQSSYDPQFGVVYVNQSSGTVIIWNGGPTNPWTVVGGMQDMSGKADILEDTDRLTPSQWPYVLINNIGDYDDNIDEEGDVIYNITDHHLYLFNGYDDNLEPVFVDMGLPQKGTIYCLRTTNALYRWTGSVTGEPWQIISSGADSADLLNKADLEHNTRMLATDQWPKVVLSSIEPITDTEARSTLSAGDLFVKTDSSNARLIYYLGGNGRIFHVGESTNMVYYDKSNKRFYLYDGAVFTPATSRDDIFLDDNEKVHGYYCHILPLASMGQYLDNVATEEGENMWGYTPSTGDYYVDPDDNGVNGVYYYDGEQGVFVRFASEFSMFFNLHTGRCYKFDSDLGDYVELTGGAVTSDNSGMISYQYLPKTVFTDMTHIHRSTMDSSTLGNVYYCTDGWIRYYYSENTGMSMVYRWVQYLPVPGLLYADQSTKTLYHWDKTTGKFVKLLDSSGGPSPSPTGASNIEVVDSDAEATDPDTLYFFEFSPSQFVGLYNKLLQNGSEGGHTYSPNNLYNLESGYFNVVSAQQKQEYITFDDNNHVYCCGKLTTMSKVGGIRVSSKVNYAVTSDTAYLEVFVDGPFYDNTTNVSVSYDNSEIDVYIKTSDSWRQLQDGSVLQFSNSDFYVARLLKIVRKDTDYSSDLESPITFDNGFEECVSRTMFSKCTLFYKNGTYSNGFTGEVSPSTATITDYATYFKPSSSSYVVIKRNSELDTRNANVLYVVFTSYSSSANNPYILSVIPGSTLNSALRNLTIQNTKLIRGTNVFTVDRYSLSRTGEFVASLLIKDVRNWGTTVSDLLLYNSGSSSNIREIGVLTYTEPF